jgi:serine/threonine protein kinase
LNASPDFEKSDHFAGRYDSLKKLGEGGMGAVYKAHDRLLDKTIVLKIIPNQINEQAVLRLQAEARTTAALKHSNIVSINDFGITDDGTPYMVMDFLDGIDLSEILKERHSLDIPSFLKILPPILDALEHAHSRNVLHRDLKPSNIMVCQFDSANPHVALVDFGIAKMLESEKLTTTGMLVGSPLYMSPEQSQFEGVDVRSDIYSLGCVMYECLTGKPPFKGSSALETMHMHVNSQPKQPSLIAKQAIPEWLETTVLRCLKKNKSDRYQSIADLKADITSGAGAFEAELDDHIRPVFEPKREQEQISNAVPKSDKIFLITAVSIGSIFLIFLGTLLISKLAEEKDSKDTKVLPMYEPFGSLGGSSDRDFEDHKYAQSTDGKNLEIPFPTAGDMERAANLPKLKQLTIREGTITAQMFKSLSKSTTLQELYLNRIKDFSGDAIKQLKKIHSLRSLNLEGSKLDLSVCEGISQLYPLQYLFIEQCSLNAKLIKALGPIDAETLSFSNSDQENPLDDSCLNALSGAKIKTLILTKNKLSATALSQLKINGLQTLIITEDFDQPHLEEIANKLHMTYERQTDEEISTITFKAR